MNKQQRDRQKADLAFLDAPEYGQQLRISWQLEGEPVSFSFRPYTRLQYASAVDLAAAVLAVHPDGVLEREVVNRVWEPVT